MHPDIERSLDELVRDLRSIHPPASNSEIAEHVRRMARRLGNTNGNQVDAYLAQREIY